MSNGRALVVGVRHVDGSRYGGREYREGCFGSELDADNVERLLKPFGYSTTVLKTHSATSDSILAQLGSAAGASQPGDLFVFYFSGHGGQHPDEGGDEKDDQDETLYAFDRRIVDDELDAKWLSFARGVRILMISDSCNSGTNLKLVSVSTHPPTPIRPLTAPLARVSARGAARNAAGGPSGGGATVLDTRRAGEAMQATMLHMGSARDGVDSKGYAGGGAFTIALCDVWQQGQFVGNYQTLFGKASVRVAEQFPQFNSYGPDTVPFSLQRPFQV